ncbi:MAG: metallophosphoesterase, partial [Eggerthellaceae bacterium]|nr:metallophosphoesterase [Eggerthellaceae bacterium]
MTMSANITRRRFVKITTAAAGLTIGSAFIAGCSSGTASSTSEATTGAVSTATYDTGRAPKFMGAMNKAQRIDTAPDESEAIAKFVVVSDTHLSFTYQAYIDRVQNMFEDIAEFCPDNDAIIVNGDITNTGSLEEYEKFAELAEASGFAYPDDFVLVIGNHDQYDSSEGTQTVSNLSDRFKEQAGISDQVHPYYDRTINGVHLILMGPDSYPESSWEQFGISAEEIEWLDNLIDVDQNKEQLSFVFMHEPLYETVRNTQPGDWGHEWSLSDQDNFNLHDCIKKHPNVIFFTGHTHALPDTVQLEDEEPLYVATGSIAYCIDDVDDDSTGNADIDEYGSLGWEVTVWETCNRFRMRDFIK